MVEACVIRCSGSGRGPARKGAFSGLGLVGGAWRDCPFIGSRLIPDRGGLALGDPGGFRHGGGGLGHHGDTPGDGFAQGGVGRHGGDLLLPKVEVSARERVEIGRPF
ncbi:hypothetical protein CU669_03930 [Paramagnetospirillum kuznetsovii]|uniref:Uncharacterized protein n=1 Tax=Paramagnetospirillum kuznetsovii TaxID=2053833 RepID=A0A364P1V6_9PROT|nr:hypothetical protein CU669_03930 [Paramagnetospirillum kuznetsovii]